MKRLWICLLALLMLAGCGSGDIAATTVYQTDDPPRAALTTERDAYDPSVETVWCILSYEGEGDPLEYGASYWLDVREEDGTWAQVPLAENTGWDAVLYTLPSGEKQAFPCSLSMFDYDFSGGGTFRVVKETGDQTLTAEFTLREGAAISAETPYGFGPMEDVPEYGDPAALATSGAAVSARAGCTRVSPSRAVAMSVPPRLPSHMSARSQRYPGPLSSR